MEGELEADAQGIGRPEDLLPTVQVPRVLGCRQLICLHDEVQIFPLVFLSTSGSMASTVDPMLSYDQRVIKQNDSAVLRWVTRVGICVGRAPSWGIA